MPPHRQPLVSVVVRTHAGRRNLLLEALQSIETQEYRPIEVIVVEDGSQEARTALEQFQKRTSLAVRYHSLPKCGRCRAGNAGLEMAGGEFLNFLDDDDQFLPNHVRLLVARLRDRPDICAAYARSLEVPIRIRSLDPLVYTAGRGRPFGRGPFSRARLWCGNFLPIQCVMFRRELFLTHGGFDPEFEQLEDWNLWVRYFARGNVDFVDEVSSLFRVPGSRIARWRRKKTHQRYLPLALRKHQEILVTASIGEIVDLAKQYHQVRRFDSRLMFFVSDWLASGAIRRTIARSAARSCSALLAIAAGALRRIRLPQRRAAQE
jgi:glycosyltransferase involved in cell wall biosynthesis